MSKKEIDKATGVETTGHEWDGLKELNNPAPRWWIWVWIVCTVWAVGYWVLYPAWPVLNGGSTGATEGILGWTQFQKLEAEQAEIANRQAAYLKDFEKASFEEIAQDPRLFAFAQAGGRSAFKDNCATCHGTGAAGGKGYPNLNDDDWLWGGTYEDIYTTLQYGIRSGHEDTRDNAMMAFGELELLDSEEITTVTDYVLSLSGKGPATQEGATIFEEQCASCHGEDGKGIRELGAPNLTDAIWLYGGDREAIIETIYAGRNGVMPAWTDRLDDNTIRQLTVYVHSLGGGE